MKIRFTQKYASGGYAPFASVYMPVAVTDPYVDPVDTAVTGLVNTKIAALTGASKASKSSSGGVDDATKLLSNLNGLTNDVNLVTQQLSRSAQENAIFGNSDNLVSNYYTNLRMVNQVKQSKEEYKDALAIAKQKNSFGDVATTMDGKIVVKSTKSGELNAISPEEFYKNRSLYIPQTNGNLLYERAHNQRYAGNDSLIQTVRECTSMQEIRKNIKDLIGDLGVDENKDTQYVQKKDGKFAQGIMALQQLGQKQQQQAADGRMPMDGVYKVTFDSKSSEQAAKYAISAIWGNLSDSQKALLKFRVGGSDSNAQALITQMVMKGLDNTVDLEIDYQNDLNTDGSKKDSNKSSGNGAPMSPQDQLLNGYTYSQNEIFNPGSAYQFNAKAMYTTLAGDELGSGDTLQDVNKKSHWNGMFDYDNFSLGGVPIDKSRFSHVVLGDSQMKVVDLPYRVDKGHIIPDMTKCKVMEKLDLQARNAGIDDVKGNEQKMNAFYVKNGQPPKYIRDTDGGWKINNSNYKSFAVLSGFADEDTVNRDSYEDPDKTLLQNDENETFYTESMQKIDKKFKLHGDVYSGSIFVPIRENAFAADVMNGSTYAPTKPKQDAMVQEAKQQQTDKYNTFRSAGNLASYEN